MSSGSIVQADPTVGSRAVHQPVAASSSQPESLTLNEASLARPFNRCKCPNCWVSKINWIKGLDSEKRYACGTCDMRFVRRDHVEKHETTHRRRRSRPRYRTQGHL